MASVLLINEDNIQKAYLAYFGRPADVAGLQFWLTGSSIPGTTMLTIMEDFSKSAEFQGIYPPPPADPSAKTGFYAQFVNDVYNNLFGRDADTEGANFYVNGLATGLINYGTAVYYIIAGAKGADATIVANKLAYAKEFTDALAGDILSNAAYDEDAFAIAREAVSGIDSSAGSLTDAIAALPDTLEAIRNADDIAPAFPQAARSVNVAENQSVVATAAATDADGDAITYSLTGADAGKFNIDANSGAITFKTAPNFEAPGSAVGTNSYSFNVVASDGVKSSSQAFTVNVTDANEAPAFGADAIAITVQEDTQITGNVNATDVDGNALTYSLLTQAAHGEVTVDANGQYYYTPDAGYKGADSFVVRVTDGALTDTMTVNVTVARADAYELTSRVDNRSGYNVFNSSPDYTPGGNDFVNTLQDEDSLEGTAASNDTLNVTLGSVNDSAEDIVSPSLTSIEIVNVEITGGNGTVSGIDFQDAAGVRELNVSRITANNNEIFFQTLQDSTNDISLSNATRNGTVEFNWAEGSLAGNDDTLAFEMKNVEQNVVAITAGDTFVDGDAPEDEGYSFEEVNVAITGATNVDEFYLEPNVEEDTRNGTDQSLNFAVAADLEVNQLIAVGVEHASIATSNGADMVVTLNERTNADGNDNKGLDLAASQTEDAKAIQLSQLQTLNITGNGDVTLNGLNGDSVYGVDVDGHTMTGELRLRLDNVVAANSGSSVKSGSGDDEIITSTDTRADIWTNEGDDHVHVKVETLEIGAAISGSDLLGDLNTGAGADRVVIEGNVYGDIDTGRTGGDSAVVDGANDGDSVMIYGNVDEASVVTGAGDDEVEVTGEMFGATIETDADDDHVDVAGDLKVVDEDDVSRGGVTTETKPFSTLNAFGAGKTLDYSDRDVTVASKIDTGAGEDTVHVGGVLESGAQWNDNKIDTPSGGNRNVDDTITIVGSEVHLGDDNDTMVLRADHGVTTDPSPLMEEQTLIDAGSGDDAVLVNYNGPIVMEADNAVVGGRNSLAGSPAAEVSYIDREVDAQGNQDTLGAKIDMGAGDDTVTFDDVGFDSVYSYLSQSFDNGTLIIDRGAVVDGGEGDDDMVVRAVDNVDVVQSRNWHDVDGGDVDSLSDGVIVGGIDGNDDADGQGGYIQGVEHITLIAENALSGFQYVNGADGNDDIGVEAPLPNDNEDEPADMRLDVNRVDSDLEDISLVANEQRLELEHTTQPDTEAQDEVDHPNGFIAGEDTYFEIDNLREDVTVTLAAYERSGLTRTHNGDLDLDGVVDNNGLEWDGEGWNTRDDCEIDVTVAVNMDRFATGNNEGFTLVLTRNADLENQDGEEDYDLEIVSVDEYALDGSAIVYTDEDNAATLDDEVNDGLLVSQYARTINIVVDDAASHSIELNNTFGNGSYEGGNSILLGSTTYLNVSGTSDGEVIELNNVRADYTTVTGEADIFVYTAGSNQFWITTDEGDDLIDLTSEADFDWERIDGGSGYDRLVISGGADITGGEFDSVYGIEDLIVEFQEGVSAESTLEVDSARLDEVTIVNNNIGEDGIADEMPNDQVGVHEVTVSATHDGPGTEHLVVDADVNNAASLEPEMCQYDDPDSNRHSDRLVLNLITTAAVIDYATDLEVYVNTAEGTQINLTNQNAAENAEINVTVSALADTVIDGTNGGNAEGELEINADSGSVDAIILHNNVEPGYAAGTEGHNVYVTVADDWADSNVKAGPDILIDASEIEDTDTNGFNEYNQFDGRAEDDSQLHIIGTQDRDEIKGGSLGDSLEGEQGDDLIYGRMGSDTINGDAGNDQIAGDEDGSSTSQSGNDVIDGGTGADFIYGGLKSDTMTGSAGADRFVYTRAFDSNGPLANVDRITDFDSAKDDATDLEHDVIDIRNLVWDDALGFDGSDVTTSTLWGKALVFDYTDTEEHILGGNVPVGDDKEAYAVAGNGLIEVIFDQATGELWFDLDDDGNLGGDDLRIKIEGAAVGQGLTAANILGASTGEATALNNSFFGPVYSDEPGFIPGTVVSDHIVIVDGSDTNIGPDGLETLAGTDGAIDLKGGDDWVMVSPASATWDLHIDGNDGDDTILSGAGDDTLLGGEGDDLVVGGAGADSIHATPGDDTVYGGSGDDNIVTEDDEDLVYGGDGNDSIDSGSGDDTVYGDGANTPSGETLLGGDLEARDVATGTGVDFDDVINAGTGNDWVDAAGGDDTVVGGEGDDALFGGAGIDLIWGGAGNDGIDGNDTIEAGEGDDTVYGHAGDDVIKGGEGEDRLLGNAGADTLWGGEGNDSISADDSIIGEDANDLVYGNEGDDFIEAGYGNDSLYGDEGADRIYGDDDDDLIDGGADSDSLEGEQGDDTVYGGTGNDYINAGTGDDYVEGGEGNDDIYGNSGDDTIYGDSNEAVVLAGAFISEANSDFIDGEDGNDLIYAGVGEDTVYGGEDSDTVYGEAGEDVLVGGEDADYIEGGDDNDVIYGDSGNWIAAAPEDANDGDDTLFGDAGDDSIYGQGGNDLIDGGLGEDWIDGGSGDDTLSGGEPTDDEGDRILGGTGNDLIDGLDGDDSIDGGDDDDTIDGGDGNDWIDGGAGNDDIEGEDGRDYIEGGSGVDLIVGGAGEDTIYGGDGNDANEDDGDSIDGGLGEDQIYGQGGDDTLTGGSGEDLIYGGDGNDDIDGGDDWDSIFGGEGSDTIVGGEGNDTIYGGDGNDSNSADGDDSIDGGLGNDWISGEYGDDTIDGGDANDTIYGGLGNDDIDGGSGNDWASGGNGDDTIVGGTGNDSINGDAEDDLLDGGDGNDTVYGGDGNDEITGGGDNDTLSGDDGDDLIYGDTGDTIVDAATADGEDLVNGGAGNDTIYGEGDDDVLYGDLGDDYIEGGDGNDILSGGSNQGTSGTTDDGDDTLLGGAGNDVIYDGEDNDVIDGGTGNDTINLQSNDGDTDLVYVGDGEGSDTITGFNTAAPVTDGLGGDWLVFQTTDVTFGDNGGIVNLVWNSGADNDDTIGSPDNDDTGNIGNVGETIANARLITVQSDKAFAQTEQQSPGSEVQYSLSSASDVDALLANQNGSFEGSVFVITDDGTNTYVFHDSDVNSIGGIELIATLTGVTNGEALWGDNIFWESPAA